LTVDVPAGEVVKAAEFNRFGISCAFAVLLIVELLKKTRSKQNAASVVDKTGRFICAPSVSKNFKSDF
jgi:hypothetical protein